MASSRPPPKVVPFKALIQGLGKSSILPNIACICAERRSPSSALGMPEITLMSAPATKALPSPVKTTARTSWSAARRSMIASSSVPTSRFKALSFSGRLMTTVATPFWATLTLKFL